MTASLRSAPVEMCTECGFSYDGLPRPEIAPELRARARRYGLILADTSAGPLRAHRRAGVWSALEYACHWRDVLRVQQGRIELAHVEEAPVFASMRREERVGEEGYNGQEPAVVAGQITAAAEALSQTLEQLDDDGWSRTGIYNWPTTQVRTVEWIGRHTVHEGVHHLMDMATLLDSCEGDR